MNLLDLVLLELEQPELVVLVASPREDHLLLLAHASLVC